MGSMIISTAQGVYNKATVAGSATNFSTGAGVTAPATSKPSTGVVFDAMTNNELPSVMRVVPFVETNSLTSPAMRFFGWSVYGNTLWIPTPILYLDLVQGSAPNASIDGTTSYFYDSVTADVGVPVPNVYDPANFTAAQPGVATVVFDMAGFQLITMQFKASGAATAGVLWATL